MCKAYDEKEARQPMLLYDLSILALSYDLKAYSQPPVVCSIRGKES